MNILLTGGSSFSGLWFAEALAERGHQVIAPLLHAESAYEGLRRTRIEHLEKISQPIFECAFGSETFLQLLKHQGPFDLFCHHAADVTDYKSPQFNFASALTSNTLNIQKVMEELKAQGCHKVLLTGSIFEQREGAGSDPLSAISPYGLSKGLTSDVFAYFTELYQIHFGKFVIPNPYGPFEEGRFTSYLAQCWLKGEKAQVSFPSYVRDNIPISLLAKSYAVFAETLPNTPGATKLNPSFRPESQGNFVLAFANELKTRFGQPCECSFSKQTAFPEPKIRINNDSLDPKALNWNETQAWDDLATFYLNIFRGKSS